MHADDRDDEAEHAAEDAVREEAEVQVVDGGEELDEGDLPRHGEPFRLSFQDRL